MRLQEGFKLDRAMLIAYAVCCALELVLLPLDGSVQWSEVGPALVLQGIVGGTLALGGKDRAERLPLIGVAGVIAYLVAVGLLRDGTSSTAGFGPLVLLPVVWASLRGVRTELAVAVVGVAVVYLAPTVLIGPPHYPSGQWRAGLLFAVISAVLGFAVIQLVGRVEALVGELVGLARTDGLTGLRNRRAWEELLERELSIARRTGQPLTVALFDLDFFKTYNDTNGHLAGDRLLLQATSAWQRVLRETDVLARWGGDEFGLLLPNCTAPQGQTMISRLRDACAEASFSAGVAEWDRESGSEAVLALADEALYAAKSGRAVQTR
jgi:diguanylate cyclase (GGDEF)-like protein